MGREGGKGGGAKKCGFMLSLAAAVIPSQPSGLCGLAPRGLAVRGRLVLGLNLRAEN